MTTTTRRPAGRPGAARSKAQAGGRSASARSGKPSPAKKRPARKPAAGSRAKAQAARQTPGAFGAAWSVVAEHAADVWGVLLVTLGVLAAVALYFDALGPVGHGVRQGLGALVGWARFLVPVACVLVGVRLLTGRRETEEGEMRREPIRAVLGAGLALLAVSGLAALAGGSPRLGASTTALAGAGGWIGALVGNPLHHGLGAFGGGVVLVAVFIVATILFTGVSVRTAAGGLARGSRWLASTVRGSATTTEDRPRLVEGHGDSFADPITAAPPGPPPEDRAVEPELPTEEAGPPDPAVLPAAATRNGKASQLEMKLGPSVGDWRLPPKSVLKRAKPQAVDEREIDAAGAALVAALAAHGVDTRLVGRTVGPSVTRYELELGAGVKVARVTSLSKDIAYAMASPDVRILAPIPGKSAIGVEVPNRRRQLVALGDILASREADQAHQPLEVALGRDIAGRAMMVNLAEMPHVLVSGATGSGKSSCINSVLTSILMRATPDQVRLILIDPKRVELGQYNGLPHLLTQVVVDPKKAANALAWAVKEMERRYDLLAEVGMRDITGFNTAFDRGELDEQERLFQTGNGGGPAG
ncbi:MAG TPA: DNA translocase FtsK 4TM domain-containing protein, partial [Acidimicrobiales bacterium]|nr:DNA translocase FtsK 4TM domain-containing protein [Acidimicrobiales bacterium]